MVITLYDVLKSLVLEANPTLPDERVSLLIKKYYKEVVERGTDLSWLS